VPGTWYALRLQTEHTLDSSHLYGEFKSAGTESEEPSDGSSSPSQSLKSKDFLSADSL